MLVPCRIFLSHIVQISHHFHADTLLRIIRSVEVFHNGLCAVSNLVISIPFSYIQLKRKIAKPVIDMLFSSFFHDSGINKFIWIECKDKVKRINKKYHSVLARKLIWMFLNLCYKFINSKIWILVPVSFVFSKRKIR